MACSSLTGRPDSLGLLCLTVAAAMWAAYTLRLRGSGLSPLQATALICFWSAVAYVPVYAASGLSHLAGTSASELLFQSVYQGLLMSVVAVFAFNRAVASLGPNAAAAVIALVPVTVTVFAIPFLGEFPSAASSVIIAAIAAGVMLAAASGKSISPKAHDPLYFRPTPDSAKVTVMPEETGLPHEAVPLDTGHTNPDRSTLRQNKC